MNRLRPEGYRANLGVLEDGTTPGQRRRLTPLAHTYFATLHQIYLIGISPGGYGPAADRLGAASEHELGQLQVVVRRAARVYAARARRADDAAQVVTGAAIAMLFCAFAFFHRRSARAHAEAARLAQENGRLLRASRAEARTDQLTGMRNRRALVDDLADVLAGRASPRWKARPTGWAATSSACSHPPRTPRRSSGRPGRR